MNITNFIWGICDDVLRGLFKQHEYGDVILPFVVLRRLDCVLEEHKDDIIKVHEKYKYTFDIAQEGFAWIADNKQEKKMIRTMKKGSRIMVSGYNQKGSQTIDHYSLLGFTKAYNAARANCS